ncbi:unnamed protein product [Gadus morhua 'NCC']
MTTVTSDDEQERGGVQEILENAMNHLKGFIVAVNIARWGRLLKDAPIRSSPGPLKTVTSNLCDPNTTARRCYDTHGVIASPLSPSAPPGRSEVIVSIVERAASSCQ